MKVLVACEFSGIVRDAFAKRGHEACSLDTRPSEAPGKHLQIKFEDAPDDFYESFDLIIAHPPCTDLAVSGARWFKDKIADGRQRKAIDFFMSITKLPTKRIAIENPVCIMSRIWRKPDQTIQPWQFGHGEVKRTCLWLKNLPKLQPTKIVEGREARIWKMPPSENRERERSRTFQGIADAMADQWGGL